MKRGGRKTRHMVPLHPRYESTFITGGVEFVAGYAEGWNKWVMTEDSSHGIFLWCASDNRVCFHSYRAANWKTLPPKTREAAIKGELQRVAGLGVNELEQLIRHNNGYDPFLDRRNREKVAKKDRRVRDLVNAGTFQDARELNAAAKRSLVHAFEKFTVAVLYGGPGYAASRYDSKIGDGLSKAFSAVRGLFDGAITGRSDRSAWGLVMRHLKHATPSEGCQDVCELIIRICNTYT